LTAGDRGMLGDGCVAARSINRGIHHEQRSF
jgi:hypothetical protein